MNQHPATTSRAARRLTGIVLLGALGIACSPDPAGSAADPASTTLVETVRGASSSTGPRPTDRPLPTSTGEADLLEADAPPSTRPGPKDRPLPTSTGEADLLEADAALAELETLLTEADDDLATPEGDL